MYRIINWSALKSVGQIKKSYLSSDKKYCVARRKTYTIQNTYCGYFSSDLPEICSL